MSRTNNRGRSSKGSKGLYNPDFWELAAGNEFLENLPASQALWFETPEGQERRAIFHDLLENLKPIIEEVVATRLTRKQREAFKLYFSYGKTQDDIATIQEVTQSTVSRNLFGASRKDKTGKRIKVGGTIPKLRRILLNDPRIVPIFREHYKRLQDLARVA